MATCEVLRCQNDPAGAIDIPGGLGMQADVCAEHKAMIENGAEWDFHFPDGYITMGEDAAYRFGKAVVIDDVNPDPMLQIELLRDGEYAKTISIRLDKQSRHDFLKVVDWLRDEQ